MPKLLLFFHVFCFIFYVYNALETSTDPDVVIDQTEIIGSSRTIEEDIGRLDADIK